MTQRTGDPATTDEVLGRIRLVLRDDLQFLPRLDPEDPHYLVEDSLRSKFYRIGPLEHRLIAQLRQTPSLQQALQRSQPQDDSVQLTAEDAIALSRWLLAMELARPADQSQAAQLLKRARDQQHQQRLGRLNPITMRWTLARPDRWITALTPWVSWFFSPWLTMALPVMIVAVLLWLAGDRQQLADSCQGILAAHNWFWLAASWLVLKVVHELGHAVVCKRYGGRVHEAGILFIVGAPLAYVDVTSSWRFASRWQRIHTSLAGMYVELWFAVLATLVWGTTQSDVVRSVAFNIMLMASATTLLFNANPLMRFDGYYFLTDLINLPNLSTLGRQYMQYLGRRYALGIRAPLPNWPAKKRNIVRFYGIASFLWRWMILWGLLVAAAGLLHGAGIVIAIAAAGLWIGRPCWQLVRNLIVPGSTGPPPRRWQFALVIAAATLVAWACWAVVPWPAAYRAAAVVEYDPLTVLHSDSPGFVRRIAVRGGQRVTAGQVLLELENEDLQLQRHELQLQIAQSEVRARSLMQQQEVAEYQSQKQQLQAQQQQLHDLQQQIQQLVITAPHDGIVVGRNLDALQGQFVDIGQELLVVALESSKDIWLAVPQDQVDVFTVERQQLRAYFPGLEPFSCRIEKVAPRASQIPCHRALAAHQGGPLAVRPQTAGDSDPSRHDGYRLVTPHFQATVSLDAKYGRRLRAGQVGWLTVLGYHDTLGRHLYRAVQDWLRQVMQRTTG